MKRALPLLLLAVCFGVLLAGRANAQFGFGLPGQMTLPENDFTWTWGNERGDRRGFEDLSIFGNQGGFRCDLKAKLRIGSRMSRMDVRALENDLRSSMNFVRAASMTMNDLDARGELDWAELQCVKPKRKE